MDTEFNFAKAIKLIGYKGNNNQKRVNLTHKNLTKHIKDQHFMYTRIPRAKWYKDKTDFVNMTRRRAINKIISTHGNKCASAPLRNYNASNMYMTINAWTHGVSSFGHKRVEQTKLP